MGTGPGGCPQRRASACVLPLFCSGGFAGTGVGKPVNTFFHSSLAYTVSGSGSFGRAISYCSPPCQAIQLGCLSYKAAKAIQKEAETLHKNAKKLGARQKQLPLADLHQAGGQQV